jgi:hypothetical protein
MSEDLFRLVREYEKRKTSSQNKLIVDHTFPQQKAFILDPSRYVGAQTTVRAGKSTGLSMKFFNKAKQHRRVMLPYIALTRDSARNIMWPILQETADRFKILCDFTESDLTCTVRETESSIKLFGADMKNFIVRLKGIKTPLAAVDECQDFRSHLEDLIDILTARISDYDDGQIAMTGTPGPVPKGFFFEVSQGKHGFAMHKWKVYDNPYMPNIQQTVDDLKRRKGWDDNNPTYRREWHGEWVADADALVYKYNAQLNNYAFIPQNSGSWHYVIARSSWLE